MLAGDIPKAIDLSQGVVGRGNRPGASLTTTSEIGVLRVDGIPIVAGRLYEIKTSPLALYSNITSDSIEAKVRTSTSGAATTSSTALGAPLTATQTATGTSFPESRALSQVYAAAASGSLSVLITVARKTGTGNAQIIVGFDVWTKDIGVDVGNTGVSL